MRKPIFEKRYWSEGKMVKLFACGVNEYRSAPNLDFCVNDAKAFCNVFQENIIINKEDITIATEDGKISNTEYCRSLKEFCANSSEEDIFGGISFRTRWSR